MPIFEYECLDCQHKFSELIFSNEKVSCPKCKRNKVKKVFSGFHTISDDTKFETGAQDLPSMNDFHRFKKTGRLKK